MLTGLLQHGGLADNVIDHRLNSRTVYMNPVSRFIYWNMNYHVEHHMFPMVPYHALPKLHEMIKHDLPGAQPVDPGRLPRNDPGLPAPAAQRGLFPEARTAADRQALPAGIARRAARCGGRIRAIETLSTPRDRRAGERSSDEQLDRSLRADDIDEEDVIRFDHGGRTFAIYRSPDDELSSPPTACAPTSRCISPTGW